MQLNLKKILIFFFLVFCYVNSSSQNEYNKINKIVELYLDDKYSETINLGKKFLNKNPDYKGAELLYLYQMMILSYDSERIDARDKNQTTRLNKLGSEMRPYVNKIISQLERDKIDDTWLSKSLGWNKKGEKWDTK